MRTRQAIAALIAALISVAPAWAHHEPTTTSTHGFAAGFAHPWFGVDHLLAMIAVGLLAAQMRGRALWVLPTAFLGMMLVGSALGIAGVELPLVETGIALSVVALGVALAWSRSYPVAAAALAIGAFGLLHGNAHGGEMPSLAQPALYACGFLLATALLHAAGILGGICLVGGRRTELALRWGGAVISCWGLVILANVLTGG